jgi:hypothetical protein
MRNSIDVSLTKTLQQNDAVALWKKQGALGAQAFPSRDNVCIIYLCASAFIELSKTDPPFAGEFDAYHIDYLLYSISSTVVAVTHSLTHLLLL